MSVRSYGFTLIELILVIAVLGILTGIVVVSYNGAQSSARNAKSLNDLKVAEDLVEIYYNKNGQYPKTTDNSQANWKSIDVRTDDNCENGTSQADWIPNVGSLPQSQVPAVAAADGKKGCYLYASNGSEYVISAWNMVSPPQTSTLYRRLGFREFQTSSSTQFYTCNSNPVGGASGTYDITKDYYKHSYTISNIADCDETPPPGA
jgi:prepilin-type N-terminal cleavage/methylation domain-containing protein